MLVPLLLSGFSAIPQFISLIAPGLFLYDTLKTDLHWQQSVEEQAIASQNHKYQGCLFGDSISSMLGDSLGKQTFNFALSQMSSVSLVEQLRQLTGKLPTDKLPTDKKVQCQTIVIAIGTNDAWYTISNDRFTQNLREALSLARSLQPEQIILLPAFYSTIEVSYQPQLAGSIARVDEINQLIQQIADQENIPVAGVPTLFEGKALKENLTIDGIHLNDAGLAIYRQVLSDLLNNS